MMIQEQIINEINVIQGMLAKKLVKEVIVEGGAGSGHWGHKGRSGRRGGSLVGGGLKYRPDNVIKTIDNMPTLGITGKARENGQYIKSPFPEIPDAEFEKLSKLLTQEYIRDHSKTETVKISSLSGVQTTVKKEYVKYFVNGGSAPKAPIVVKYGGKSIIWDGHNRAAAYYYLGKSLMQVRAVSVGVMDLPENARIEEGGPGSGHWGHAGRHSRVGGSQAGFVSTGGLSKEEAIKIAADRGISVPPMWENITVSANVDSALQVIGKDIKGRRQYLYSAEHSQKAAAEKFQRLKEFSRSVKDLERRIDADFDKNNEAKVLYLISKTGFRIGSDRDTMAKVKAFGASTLTDNHVAVSGSYIKFNFTAKKGVKVEKMIKDERLAKHIAGKKGMLFDTTPGKIRKYLKDIDGDFQVKDFRTYIGTATALKAINNAYPPKSGKDFKKATLAVCKKVASVLGNTPGVAKRSYIAPEVWDRWKIAIS